MKDCCQRLESDDRIDDGRRALIRDVAGKKAVGSLLDGPEPRVWNASNSSGEARASYDRTSHGGPRLVCVGCSLAICTRERHRQGVVIHVNIYLLPLQFQTPKWEYIKCASTWLLKNCISNDSVARHNDFCKTDENTQWQLFSLENPIRTSTPFLVPTTWAIMQRASPR